METLVARAKNLIATHDKELGIDNKSDETTDNDTKNNSTSVSDHHKKRKRSTSDVNKLFRKMKPNLSIDKNF